MQIRLFYGQPVLYSITTPKISLDFKQLTFMGCLGYLFFKVVIYPATMFLILLDSKSINSARIFLFCSKSCVNSSACFSIKSLLTCLTKEVLILPIKITKALSSKSSNKLHQIPYQQQPKA